MASIWPFHSKIYIFWSTPKKPQEGVIRLAIFLHRLDAYDTSLSCCLPRFSPIFLLACPKREVHVTFILKIWISWRCRSREWHCNSLYSYCYKYVISLHVYIVFTRAILSVYLMHKDMYCMYVFGSLKWFVFCYLCGDLSQSAFQSCLNVQLISVTL